MILSTAPGNPAIVARPIVWAANLIGHIVIVNAAFATLRLLLAIGLFCRPTGMALAASIAWSAALWWLGEGFGGVLTGSLDPFGGAPGAVVLYVVVALVVWPRREGEPEARWVSVAETGPLGSIGAKVLWTVLWAGLGYAALLPATRGRGVLGAVVFAALCGAAAATIAFGRFTRLGVIAAIVVGVVIWVAQDLANSNRSGDRPELRAAADHHRPRSGLWRGWPGFGVGPKLRRGYGAVASRLTRALTGNRLAA